MDNSNEAQNFDGDNVGHSTSDSHSSNELSSKATFPKPYLSGYQMYFKSRQSELRNQIPKLNFNDIVKLVGNEWSKTIDPSLKNVNGQNQIEILCF